MTSPLTNIARFTTGISTPHYLYLNEAVFHIVEVGTAARTARALNGIFDHARDESPEHHLIRMTQSTSYHQSIVARPEAVNQIVTILQRESRVEPHHSLAMGPTPEEQALLFDARSFDLGRGIDQLACASQCYAQYAKLDTSDDALTDLMDVFLPALHWVAGTLLFLGMAQYHRLHGSLSGDNAIAWFRQTDALLETLKGVYEWFIPTVHSLAGGALKIAAEGGKEHSSILHGEEIDLLVMTLIGIDQGLQSLGFNLIAWSGNAAQQLGMAALQVQLERSQPLLRKFAAIANGQPY